MTTTSATSTPVVLDQDSQEGLFSGILDSFKKGLSGGRGESVISGIAAESYKQASELLSVQQNLVGVLGTGNESFTNMTAGVNEMQEKFWSMQTAGGTALNTVFANQGEVIKEYQGIINSNLLQIHATSKTVTAREMADLALYGKALNFNAGESQKFLERQFALTGEVNDDLLKQTLAYSSAIEKSTGISSKIIAGNISGMMSDVRTFGNMTVEEMSEAAAAIAKVGLEVTDVAGLVKAFSSFEGAADSVSKLTQVFGVQMDTMKYMTASFESPEEMLAMIQEDFETAGVDMANMNMAQKRLLSDTLGMDVSSVESLLGEAGSGLSQFTNQVSGATAGVGASELDGALAQADSDIERINHMYGSANEAGLQAGRRTASAIGSVFSTELARIGTEAQALAGTGIALSSGIAFRGKTVLAEAIGLSEIGDAVSRVATTINEEGEALLTALNDGEDMAGWISANSAPPEGTSSGSASGGQSSPAIPDEQQPTSRATSTGNSITSEEINGTAEVIIGATVDSANVAQILSTLSEETNNVINNQNEAFLASAVEAIIEAQSTNREELKIDISNIDGTLNFNVNGTGWQPIGTQA